MPRASWDNFQKLPGSTTDNFERLCRRLISLHYGKHGDFRALANQPGVEFHLKLRSECPLGSMGDWLGWQCRWYELSPGSAIGASRRKKIEEAIRLTEKCLPDLTHWILWTRHVLTKSDQDWYFGLSSSMRLALWSTLDIESLLV